jgi:hypothetical protein
MIEAHVWNKSYVPEVLALYTALPETPSRARPADRKLAEDWQRRGITLEVIESAMLLGELRRLARPPDYPKLNPIRSLYYFVPLIEEVMEKPLPDDYVEYMRSKLRKLAPGKPDSSPQVDSQTGE